MPGRGKAGASSYRNGYRKRLRSGRAVSGSGSRSWLLFARRGSYAVLGVYAPSETPKEATSCLEDGGRTAGVRVGLRSHWQSSQFPSHRPGNGQRSRRQPVQKGHKVVLRRVREDQVPLRSGQRSAELLRRPRALSRHPRGKDRGRGRVLGQSGTTQWHGQKEMDFHGGASLRSRKTSLHEYRKLGAAPAGYRTRGSQRGQNGW
jgi:hypothetical protein